MLLKINYNREPFTHIYEWKRYSPSFGSASSLFWILVVATVALGSTSMIYFPLSFHLLGSDLESKHVSDLEVFSSATLDSLAQHSLVLWVGLLWNSHHFPMSFFIFMVFFFSCSFDDLSSVAPPWIFPFLRSFGVPFPCFGLADPKSHFFYSN